jgi:hypothetical protein
MKQTNFFKLGGRLFPYYSILAAFSTLSLVVSGCEPDVVEPSSTVSEVAKHSSEVPRAWFNLQLQLIEKTPGNTPPVSSRTLGYTGVALYEALLPGMAGHKSLVGQLNALTSLPEFQEGEYYWPAVANAVLASSSRFYFDNAPSTLLAKIDSLEQVTKSSFTNVSAEVLTRSEERGRTIANAIYEWSKSDGGDEGYLKNFPTDYQAPSGPGMWVPTSAAQPRPLQPYWGKNRPFVLPSGDPNRDIGPGAPMAFSTEKGSPFYNQAEEVVYNCEGA